MAAGGPLGVALAAAKVRTRNLLLLHPLSTSRAKRCRVLAPARFVRCSRLARLRQSLAADRNSRSASSAFQVAATTLENTLHPRLMSVSAVYHVGRLNPTDISRSSPVPTPASLRSFRNRCDGTGLAGVWLMRPLGDRGQITASRILLFPTGGATKREKAWHVMIECSASRGTLCGG